MVVVGVWESPSARRFLIQEPDEHPGQPDEGRRREDARDDVSAGARPRDPLKPANGSPDSSQPAHRPPAGAATSRRAFLPPRPW